MINRIVRVFLFLIFMTPTLFAWEAPLADQIWEQMIELNRVYAKEQSNFDNERVESIKSEKGSLPWVLVLQSAEDTFPPNIIFHLRPERVLTVKVLGPVVKVEDTPGAPILGTIEYLVLKYDIELVVVLGTKGSSVFDFVSQQTEDRRSAQKPSATNGSVGSVTEEIQRSVTKAFNEGSADLSHESLVVHILDTAKELENSPQILKKMVDSGHLKIVPAIFDPETKLVVGLEKTVK